MTISGTGRSGDGWGHLLGLLRQLISSSFARERPESDHFVEDILRYFRRGVELEDEAIGKWFVTIDAADWDDNRTNNQVGIRFLITRDPRPVQEEIRSEPLWRPKQVYHDFGKPQKRSDDVVLFFNFTSLLPVSKNLELFKEFAISQIKDLKVDPP